MEETVATFEQWVRWVFDHPVATDVKDEWWWKDRADDEGGWLDRPPERALAFVISLFEDPTPYLSDYSDGQINQGLEFIVFSACSRHFSGLTDRSVDFELRSRCIRSLESLFRELIAQRTSDDVKIYTRPLDHMCDMLWDMVVKDAYDLKRNSDGTFRSVRDPEIDKVILGTLSRILAMPSIGCQQSALHGLGHLVWEAGIGTDVVQQYLDDHPSLRGDVREYALKAQAGKVL